MKNTISSLLILLPALLSAQDVLYKTDNSKLDVKVYEISESSIRYKIFNNQEGPLYVVSKSDVALIIYQNGQHEVFKSNPIRTSQSFHDYQDSVQLAKKNKRYLHVTQNKNVVFVNALEFFNSGVGISYLREVCDNRISIHVPFAMSYGSPGMDNALSALGGNYGNYRITQTKYDIGLGLYFNTSGKRAITHFVGPLIRNAQYSGTWDSYTYNGSSYSFSKKPFEMNETSLMLNNGFLYRFTPSFNMMLNIAVGKFISRTVSRNSDESAGIYSAPEFSRNIALHAGIHFGYRF